MSPLDSLDLAILVELEKDARITITELARRLDSPNSTIRDRIKGLEESGVILGYKAAINPEKLGLGIKAIIQVTRDSSVSLADFHAESLELEQITNVQLVTGETDALITVYASDVDQLKDIIYNKVGTLPGLTRSNTTIVLEETSFPLTRRFLVDEETAKSNN